LVIPTAFDRWLIIASAFFVRQSDFAGATKLIARINVNRERPNIVLLNVEKNLFADLLVQCRAALTPEEFDAAWARGQTMTNEEAIALVAEALR
jgi:hypothetical protein